MCVHIAPASLLLAKAYHCMRIVILIIITIIAITSTIIIVDSVLRSL